MSQNQPGIDRYRRAATLAIRLTGHNRACALTHRAALWARRSQGGPTTPFADLPLPIQLFLAFVFAVELIVATAWAGLLTARLSGKAIRARSGPRWDAMSRENAEHLVMMDGLASTVALAALLQHSVANLVITTFSA